MADGCFLVLCGIPASGKSSLANELISMNWKIAEKCLHFIYVRYDDFIPERKPSMISSALANWKTKRRTILNGLEEFVISSDEDKQSMGIAGEKSFTPNQRNRPFSISCPCHEGGNMTRASNFFHVVVIDDNMYYRSMRYEYYQLARKASFSFTEVYIHCPLDVALNRNAKRFEAVAEDTIVKMINRLEKPDPQKFSWEKYSITLDTTKEATNKWEKIFELLRNAANNVPPPLKVMDEKEKFVNSGCHQRSYETFLTSLMTARVHGLKAQLNKSQAKDRAITEKNIVHQADQVIRKHISARLQQMRETVSPEDLKPVALSLNKRRKKVMEMLKNDPRKITANIVLEHSKFSCEIEENEISQEGQASASVTSQCFDSELKVKEIIDKGLSTVNFPTATNCYSNELEPSQVVHRPEINKCLTSTADEIESSLFLENIWDIVSVDEFADIIRNFFEQHA